MAGLLEVELTQGVTDTATADQGNFATLAFFCCSSCFPTSSFGGSLWASQATVFAGTDKLAHVRNSMAQSVKKSNYGTFARGLVPSHLFAGKRGILGSVPVGIR
jgi:hypothetical protein